MLSKFHLVVIIRSMGVYSGGHTDSVNCFVKVDQKLVSGALPDYTFVEYVLKWSISREKMYLSGSTY